VPLVARDVLELAGFLAIVEAQYGTLSHLRSDKNAGACGLIVRGVEITFANPNTHSFRHALAACFLRCKKLSLTVCHFSHTITNPVLNVENLLLLQIANKQVDLNLTKTCHRISWLLERLASECQA
jgi:hypothetical protein